MHGAELPLWTASGRAFRNAESRCGEKAAAPGGWNRLAEYGIIEFVDICLRWAESWPIINPDDKLDRRSNPFRLAAHSEERRETNR
jgi:hypothetical protein